MSRGQALTIIQSQSGSQFDATLCEHFLALGRRGLLDPVIAHSDDGIPLQHCPMCGPTLVVRREQQSGEFQRHPGSSRCRAGWDRSLKQLTFPLQPAPGVQHVKDQANAIDSQH
jgi:hypothetical protein